MKFNLKSLKQRLKQNDFVNIVYRMLTNKEYRGYCADYTRNARCFRFEHLGEENPGENIYLIREGTSWMGMFALIVYTLRRLEVAERFHFTPVVEWTEDIPFAVADCNNPFLLYFQPVSDITPESARSSADVAFAHTWDKAYGAPVGNYEFSQEEIERFSQIYRKYMRLQPKLETRIEQDISELFGVEHGKILGAHVRGVEWRKTKVYRHPIPISEEDYLHKAQEIMYSLGYEKIFLATDSDETIRKFQEGFGDRLITTQAMRAPAGSNTLAIFDEKNDGYQMGFEILRDAYALAACDSLLCGLSYVSYGAQIINRSAGRNYESTTVLDKGKVNQGISTRAAWKKLRK